MQGELTNVESDFTHVCTVYDVHLKYTQTGFSFFTLVEGHTNNVACGGGRAWGRG